VLKARSVFISDVHLGHRGCRAESLLAFLGEIETRNIFVIGDLIDFWALRRSFCWPQAHQDVLRMLVERAQKGVRVIYVPGNHDDAAREFIGMSICGIEIRRQHVHRTADGQRLLLLHGDEFDAEVRCGRLRVRLGAGIYNVALRLNHMIYCASRSLGLGEWSLTAWLKQRVSNARAYISLFEEAAARAAAREGCDGVICGHIHHAAIRDIDGVLYCNDGDWVESCSSLLESPNGKLTLMRWSEYRALGAEQPQPAYASAGIAQAARISARIEFEQTGYRASNG
jgi:UDP-2,3-diacylglucosamine pyrophosphatase LpxH